MDISDNEMAYYLLEITYTKMQGKDDNLLNYNQDIFPFDWTSMPIETRYEILKEAVEKNMKIVETNGYNEHCEGVYFEH